MPQSTKRGEISRDHNTQLNEGQIQAQAKYCVTRQSCGCRGWGDVHATGVMMHRCAYGGAVATGCQLGTLTWTEAVAA